jgi:aquaporin Z
MNNKFRAGLAELMGSFAVFFIGAGSIAADSYTHGGVGLIGIALANGLALAIMISALGSFSGGYFNPAVTIGLWVARKINASTAVLFIISQLLGGMFAGYALRMIFPPTIWMPVHLGAPVLALGVSPLTGLLLEAILTSFLLLAVLGAVAESRAPNISGFVIGLTVTAGTLIGGPLTGAAMNPARAFGPALAAGFWEYQWVFWTGPILGAAVISWIYSRLIA